MADATRKVAGGVAEAGPGGGLDGDAVGVGRGWSAGEMAKRWGHSVRAVKYWIAKGKELGDPPPLDRPREMAKWFARTHERRAPRKLLAAVARLAQAEHVAEVAAKAAEAAGGQLELAVGNGGVAGPVGAVEAEVRRVRGMVAGTGDDALDAKERLERLKREEIELHRRYRAAREAGEPEAALLKKEWHETLRALEGIQKTELRLAVERGRLWEAAAVKRELADLHAAQARAIRVKWKRARGELRKVAGEPEQWAALVDRVVDELFAGWVASRFEEEAR